MQFYGLISPNTRQSNIAQHMRWLNTSACAGCIHTGSIGRTRRFNIKCHERKHRRQVMTILKGEKDVCIFSTWTIAGDLQYSFSLFVQASRNNRMSSIPFSVYGSRIENEQTHIDSIETVRVWNPSGNVLVSYRADRHKHWNWQWNVFRLAKYERTNCGFERWQLLRSFFLLFV